MKQSHNRARLRIERGESRSFVAIAVGAGQRQIVERIVSDVLLGLNMLDVEREKRSRRLRESAILAPMTCPNSDLLAGGGVHGRLSVQQAPGSGLHHGDKVEGGEIAVVFALFDGRQRPLIRFFRQLINSKLQCVVRLEGGDLLRSLGRQAVSKGFDQLVEQGGVHRRILPQHRVLSDLKNSESRRTVR